MQQPFCEITKCKQGFLAIMPKPAGFDALKAHINEFKCAGATTIVSLLGTDEAEALGLSLEAHECRLQGLEFYSHPITDFGVPQENKEFIALILDTAESVKLGAGVVAHCKGGIGRSGLFSVAVLMALGVDREQAIQDVSTARGVTVPETAAQRQWLIDNESAFTS